MKKLGLILVLALSSASTSAADDHEAAAAVDDVIIVRIVDDGWGEANPETVERLLDHTARHFLQHFPDRLVGVVEIKPKGGPIVLFRRGPAGEYRVRLNTGDRYWSQYVFQFSHELCHILTNYDDDPHGNDWFEEALCELASLYVLRQMGEVWKTDAPYPHWKAYAAHLTTYAQQRIDKASMDERVTLAQWYRQHEKTLRRFATRRSLNNVVAVELLPLFESQPESWEAVTWLNAAEVDHPQTFREYLRDWHDHAPPRHRLFIRKIAAKFGVSLLE